MMTFPAIFLIIIFFIAINSIKILREYERGVVFRLGRFAGVRGPGLIILIPLFERMVKVTWEGENEATFRVEIQIDAYDRTRLLEDLSRTFAEVGVNIISAECTTNAPMVKNRFVVEVGDTGQLKQCIARMRHVESVFDAYRVTPGE